MKAMNTHKSLYKIILLTIVSFVCFSVSYAQPTLPQRTLTVTATQAIHFGTLGVTGGAGGTVTVGWDGSRSSSGSIVLLSVSPTAQPAIFEIKLCQGRNVTISFGASTTLTGSNGGTLVLDIGPTDQGANGAFFPTKGDCNFITPLRVGGTLHVPGAVIPGIYSGSFAITFNQE